MGLFSSKSDEEKAAKQEKDRAFRDFVQARDRSDRDAAEARGKEAQKRPGAAKRNR